MGAVADPTMTGGGTAWHAMSADGVVKSLATDSEKGLDAAEAARRLQAYGPNRLPEGKKRGPLMRFLSQFNNVLVYVLLGAGFTKLMLNHCWGSYRRAGPRRHWTRSATCCPPRLEPCAAARRA